MNAQNLPKAVRGHFSSSSQSKSSHPGQGQTEKSASHNEIHPPESIATNRKESFPMDDATSKSALLDKGQRSRFIRDFDPNKQRRRILATGLFRFAVTIVLTLLLTITLYSFDHLGRAIRNVERRGFNAVMAALVIVLSENLFFAMQGCADIVRWRLLASQYITLKQFDLMLDCESKWTTFWLLWHGRTPGQLRPSKIQLMAALYLLVSVGLLVDTSMLGLTYAIQVTSRYTPTKLGTISVPALSNFSPDTPDSPFAQVQQAQNYGLASQSFFLQNSSLEGGEVRGGGLFVILTNEAQDLFWYRFIDASSTNIALIRPSDRYVASQASCREVEVVSGGHAGFNLTTLQRINETVLEIRDGDSPVEQLTLGDYQSVGGTTWMAGTTALGGDCGPRCINLWALQSGYPAEGRMEPRFWKCTNTVSRIFGTEEYGDGPEFLLNDTWATVMAGAIGFSGSTTTSDSFDRFLYNDGSPSAPANNETGPGDMAAVAMRFSAGAFAALDGFGRRVNVTGQQGPVPAQTLRVNWEYAGLLLVLAPLVQAIALTAAVMYGNKAVILENSALANARLLRPFVEQLGKEGSLMTMDEIAKEVGKSKVRYGVRYPEAGEEGDERAKGVKRLEIITEDESRGKWTSKMPAGKYE